MTNFMLFDEKACMFLDFPKNDVTIQNSAKIPALKFQTQNVKKDKNLSVKNCVIVHFDPEEIRNNWA